MAGRMVLYQCVRQISMYSRLKPCVSGNASINRLMEMRNSQFIRTFAAAASTDGENNEANETEEGSSANNSPPVDPKKDRRNPVPVETSIKYLESKAYSTTYGDDPVWVRYRRNFKGQWAPDTRKTCIRNGQISTGNPCPICRDEYLVIDHQNIELLKQFVSPYNGEILPTKKTGLCRFKHRELTVAVMKARDYGLLSFDVPTRDYDYSEYVEK